MLDNLEWNDLKQIIASCDLLLQYIELDSYYYIWTTDSIIKFEYKMRKTDPRSDEQIDFEDNYKTESNKLKYGRPLVQATARPEGTTSYFTGAGDNGGISSGNELLFSLGAGEASKSIDLTFSEDVWFKDGQIWSDENTPFGAYLDTEIIHPATQQVVGSFGRKIFLMKDWLQPMDTEDRGLIHQGLIVRLTINNSDGSGIKESPVAFKAIGRLEIYRETQV